MATKRNISKYKSVSGIKTRSEMGLNGGLNLTAVPEMWLRKAKLMVWCPAWVSRHINVLVVLLHKEHYLANHIKILKEFTKKTIIYLALYIVTRDMHIWWNHNNNRRSQTWAKKPFLGFNHFSETPLRIKFLARNKPHVLIQWYNWQCTQYSKQ